MDRNTPWCDGQIVDVPMAAATEIFGGHLVALNAAGFAVPGSAVAAQTTFGVSNGWVDNKTGLAGDARVLVRRGKAWLFANAGSDAVTQAEVGKSCYVVDSVTVAKSSNEDARPVAGTVLLVTDDGVWVEI